MILVTASMECGSSNMDYREDMKAHSKTEYNMQAAAAMISTSGAPTKTVQESAVVALESRLNCFNYNILLVDNILFH